jgi:hypothetical protein
VGLLSFAVLVLVPLGTAPPASGSTKSPVEACTGPSLTGAFAYSNVYAGGAVITIAIVNVGTSTCRLGGYPKLTGIRGGHGYAFASVAHSTQDVSLEPTVLSPRESGALILDTSLGCNANVYPYPPADVYTGLIIILPHGKGRVRVAGLPLFVPCGLGESQLGWAKGFVFD